MIRVFKRSCTDWKSFFRARKITHAWVRTPDEAIAMCDRFNENRTAAQVRKGTKLEWMED
jgi:hypothetical protein